jgi:hypothetical protein
MNSKTLSTTALLSVYDGRQCAGFVLKHGSSGFEAFERRLARHIEGQDAAAVAPLRVIDQAIIKQGN